MINDCERYKDQEISKILQKWLELSKKYGMKEQEKLFLKLYFLSEGAPFFKETIDRMAVSVLQLEKNKPDVQKVIRWMNDNRFYPADKAEIKQGELRWEKD